MTGWQVAVGVAVVALVFMLGFGIGYVRGGDAMYAELKRHVERHGRLPIRRGDGSDWWLQIVVILVSLPVGIFITHTAGPALGAALSQGGNP